jgi:tRNA A37 methylthiotransferase MiaB
MKKIYIYVFGCKGISFIVKKIERYFTINNYEIADNPKNADLILFIPCAVYDKTTQKSLEKIKKLQKYKGELIICGCLPDIEPQKLKTVFQGKTVGLKNLHKLDDLFPENSVKFKSIDDPKDVHLNTGNYTTIRILKTAFSRIKLIEKIYLKFYQHVIKNLFKKKSPLYEFLTKKKPYYIRISDGCLKNCSFCADKLLSNGLKSKIIEQCYEEFKKGLKQSHKEFIILADDPGAYGLDIGKTLPELLKKLLSVSEDYEIIIHSIGPEWIVKYFEEFKEILKTNKIKRINVSLQSSSPRILKLMNRYSDIKKIKECLQYIKKQNPEVVLSIHYLLGFPSETEEEFRQNLDFIVNVMNFDSGVIFPFHQSSVTTSKEIKPEIKTKEISKRIQFSKRHLRKNGYKVYSVYSYMEMYVFDKK